MYKIVSKVYLNPSIVKIDVEAPRVTRNARAGQFVIVRAQENAERIPLTIANSDKEKGQISLIYQVVGRGTQRLNELNEGDAILDVMGPLGMPTKTEGVKRACVVGGGTGCAIALPLVRQLYKDGAKVHSIMGFRTKDLIILEKEFKEYSERVELVTDDGTAGTKGLVTDALKKLIEEGNQYDEVFAVGPLIMMKFISKLTKEYGIKTSVSMNPIMVDGTGMCGCCRVMVGGKLKFACVDGPDFDGHQIDFDETMSRARTYIENEEHICNLTGEKRHGK